MEHKRKIKPYHPRASHHERSIEKQQLSDLEHRIAMDLGNFLVLLEEGSTLQAEHAKQRAKSDLIKFGPDMQKIAEKIGGKIPFVVDAFLESIDMVLHTGVGWIDEAKISECYRVTQKLEKELHLG